MKTPTRIPSVSVASLAEARADGRLDDGASALVDAEREYLSARRQTHGLDDRTDGVSALCISGGGIRSASFATGVLQALARADLLKRFDYLSTVSGGGYIGTSVSWLLSRHTGGKVGTGPDSFPFGTENPEAAPEGGARRRDGADQIKMLQYLRSHGRYLTPGKGISMASLMAVILRGMFLTLLVMIPLIAALFAVIILLVQDAARAFDYIRHTAYVSAGLLGLASLLYAVTTVWYRPTDETGLKYRARRLYDKYAGSLLVLTLIVLMIGVVPLVHVHVGSAALLVGIHVGALVFTSAARSKKKVTGINAGSLAPIGAGLVLYGMIVLAHRLAEISACLIDPGVTNALGETCPAVPATLGLLPGVNVPLSPDFLFSLPFVIAGLALLAGRFVNINYISIHRYYRDRLMETFMPDRSHALSDATGPSRAADSMRMSELARSESPVGPYHILNTNINLSGADSRIRRNRGGDSFILSPMYCGSSETGWRRTDEFMRDGMTLATAMAISGAAAEPNAGVGGEGVTRSASVAMLMSMLNLTLGYWVTHPLRRQRRIMFPNHFNPGMSAMLAGGYSARRRYLELGDGGHFENLGLYEMIRRRARLVIVSDGGADPDYRFFDLLNAIRKVEEDFGARIVFTSHDGSRVHPTDHFQFEGNDLPSVGHIIGRIEYADGSEGTLILIKSSMVERLGFPIEAYREKHPEFPHQSTANQNFGEEQFDAYRRLGYELTRRMIEDAGTHAFTGFRAAEAT